MEKLTQSKCLQLFEYKDGSLFWRNDRSRIRAGDKAGCLDKKGYVQVKIDGKPYKAHRVIFLLINGFLPDVIDHIDGNPANNRIENLRACTQQQNVFNAGTRSTNTSGYTGVYWDRKNNKWRAAIRVSGRMKVLGRFDSIESAIAARTQAAKAMHGEFFRA